VPTHREDTGPVALPRRRRPASATVGVTLVLTAAGLLFATSAETARGTQLRSDRSDAVGLVRSEQERLQARLAQHDELVRENEALVDRASQDSGVVRRLQDGSSRLAPGAGLAAVSGPAVRVTLSDAPPAGRRTPGITPDALVVHQQDVQAVVNALWAGGAEAMTLMDQRVISTSAVRCVGNTLILQGRVYSPPYRITAVGDPQRLHRALAASPQLDVYQQYVRAVGLGWQVEDLPTASMPAYSGPLELRYARVPGGASQTPTGTLSGTATRGATDDATRGTRDGASSGNTPDGG
jgi:uncharacterized protein YlxW (UPF0749 family)